MDLQKLAPLELEVTHLREQVRLLTQENEHLRSFIADNDLSAPLSLASKNKADEEHRERKALHRSHAANAKSPKTPVRPGTPRAPGRGCSCKGNCSTRICGCVKRNIPCAEFCRCGDALCQNSEPDKENIGDPNHQPELSEDAAESLTKLSKLALAENNESEPSHPALEPVNKRLDKMKKRRGLFSPDVADQQYNFETADDIEYENVSLRFGDAPNGGDAEEEALPEKPSDRNKNKKKKKGKQKNVDIDDRELNVETMDDIESEETLLRPGDVPEAGEAEEEALPEKPSDRNKNKKKKKGKQKNVDIDDRELNVETMDDIESEETLLRPGDVPEAGEAEEEALPEKPSDRNKNKKKKKGKQKNVDIDDRELNVETMDDIESEETLLRPGDVPEAGEAEEEALPEKPSDRNKNKKKKKGKQKNVDIDDRELNLETMDDIESEETLLRPGDAPKAGEATAEAVAKKTSDRKKNKEKKTERNKNENDEEQIKKNETHRSATAPDPKATTPDKEKVATDFDPMKPRRQLSRSPLVSQTVPRTEQPMDASEKPLPAPVKEEPEEEPLEPEELKQDIVPDWNQHMANLVECSICKRKLYPHRIKKHEASCQNI